MMKRTFDLFAALAGILILWPLFVVAAALIKLDSPGPIFYRQVRVGQGLRPFRIWKFRTMVEQSPSNGQLLTIGQDKRITRMGRYLREYKLDELPQLFNILLGDMSVVGPRPEVPRYVELFRSQYKKILTVRPGLTDLASLMYVDESATLAKSPNPEETYQRTILPEKIRWAELYVRHSSFLFDLAIIVQTVLCLVKIPIVVCDIPEFLTSAKQAGVSSLRTVKDLGIRFRRPIIISLDLILIVIANYLAFWLRFDGAIPSSVAEGFRNSLPWLVAIRAVAFALFRLNEGLWRYTSVWDFRNIIIGVSSSTLVFYGWVHWGMGHIEYPGSIYVVDSILLVCLLTGVRLSARLLRDKLVYRRKKRVLVIGAGDSGERIVREMKTQVSYNYQPIGFIDDDESLRHQRIHGVKVLGTRNELLTIVKETKPAEVVLALKQAKPALVREIISVLEPFKLLIKTVPSMNDLLVEQSVMSQVRKLDVADLLPRAPVELDIEMTRQMVAGKCIVITGAGGSIGSELTRQIAGLQPRELVLYERHENSLYTISKELDDQGCSSIVVPVIGDVTDVRRFSMTLEKHRPSILFHAAAHKHVPLVESNAAEAVKNNCMGTRIAAELAHRFGVERFVLVSTDKAVNPSSVMGATKRIAELIVQSMSQRSSTSFLTVRFGNVLGSNGSVLLRFQEQIKAGGPVTVTHPAIRRYFMLIPEAVHLVLQAASLGEQGVIYILDMGEQIRVLDLARNLIRLSGFVPGEEIPIRYIGLRPGEKLYEELVGEGEVAEPSGTERILRVRTSAVVDFQSLEDRLTTLEAAGHLKNSSWMMEQLHELIPTFRNPDGDELQSSIVDEAAEEETAVSSEGPI